MEKKNNIIIYPFFVLMLITQLLIGYMIYQNGSNDRYMISQNGSNDRYTFFGNDRTILLDKRTGVVTQRFGDSDFFVTNHRTLETLSFSLDADEDASVRLKQLNLINK